MKKLMIIAASLMIGAFAASAGEACCPSAKAEKKADVAKEECADKVGCDDMAKCGAECLEAVELTDDQKEQLASLKSDCDKTECDETSAKKMSAGLDKILTADQKSTLKAACDEKGCGEADS